MVEPIRRIVVVKRHELLREAWSKRSFSLATTKLDEYVVEGFQFDKRLNPVPLRGKASYAVKNVKAVGFNYETLNQPVEEQTYALRAYFDDKNAIQQLKGRYPEEIVQVYADPKISIFPKPYCKGVPLGDWKKVATKLGVGALRKAKLSGKGVRIAVVDTGIDGSRIPVSGGWSPDPNYKPGTAELDHGTMVAFDARISAPESEILDYALLRSKEETWTGFLSDALSVYADMLDLLQREPGPLVVNNSWGMFDRSEDAPIGSPENYSANPDHPFNQIVGTLVAAGADVLFAAGNCGKPCPDGRCGSGDTGPGASIHGANSHPDVITVAAITTDGRRLGYSSQGPGALYKRKPDIAAYSHFSGSGVYEADAGTSAASPVAAGVVALLRQKFSNATLSPEAMKGLIQKTAVDINKDGWDFDLGYGAIDARRAFKALSKK